MNTDRITRLYRWTPGSDGNETVITQVYPPENSEPIKGQKAEGIIRNADFAATRYPITGSNPKEYYFMVYKLPGNRDVFTVDEGDLPSDEVYKRIAEGVDSYTHKSGFTVRVS